MVCGRFKLLHQSAASSFENLSIGLKPVFIEPQVLTRLRHVKGSQNESTIGREAIFGGPGSYASCRRRGSTILRFGEVWILRHASAQGGA